MSNPIPVLDVQTARVADCNCKLGEGPLWDWRDNLLCFVDIQSDMYLRLDAASGDNLQRLPVGQKIGCSALRAEGGYLLGLRDGFWIFEPQNNRLEKWVAPANHPDNVRFNDGKTDPAGRFWAGTMSLRGEKGAGVLYCLHPDGRIEDKVHDVSISNGLAWSSDRTKFYFIDTPTRRVDVFDYNVDTGEISNRRPCIEFPEGVGSPDGMTIDENDHLWVAMWGGSGVLHCDPAAGKVIEKLELPTEKTTCPAFGGMEMDELFVTTAGGSGDATDQKSDPAGDLFSAKLPVKGPQAVLFGA